uniref:hypothetical protein n=1 Tax=unclassified Variovorax TaxID=663243 RepID=UPI00104A2108
MTEVQQLRVRRRRPHHQPDPESLQPGDTDPTHSTIANANVTWTVGYNAVGRIVSFNATGNTAGFGYDANGNRRSGTRVLGAQTTSRTYTVGSSSNRLTGFTQKINSASSTSVTYGYNANGDLVNDGLRTYTYDAEGRLAAATTGATDASPTTRWGSGCSRPSRCTRRIRATRPTRASCKA